VISIHTKLQSSFSSHCVPHQTDCFAPVGA